MPNENFDDPLKDIDPIMENAFSLDDDEVAFPDPPQTPPQNETAYQQKEVAPSPRTREPQDNLPNISQIEFPSLSPESGGTSLKEGVFSNIPVKVSVELGRSQLSLKEVYELSEGAIIELERLVGEPLDLVINDQVIAQGEVVAIDNKYGLRIKTLIDQPGQ